MQKGKMLGDGGRVEQFIIRVAIVNICLPGMDEYPTFQKLFYAVVGAGVFAIVIITALIISGKLFIIVCCSTCFLFNVGICSTLLELGGCDNVVLFLLFLTQKLLDQLPVHSGLHGDGREGLMDVDIEALQADDDPGQAEVCAVDQLQHP